MICLGIDYGDKRMGLAISDELGITADPLITLNYQNITEVLEKIKRLLQEYRVDSLVIGIPKRTSGEEGPEAKKVRHFAEMLRKTISCQIETWDERFSSKEADRLFQELDLSPKKKRSKRDAVAAKIMLQNYLDFKRIQKQSCTD